MWQMEAHIGGLQPQAKERLGPRKVKSGMDSPLELSEEVWLGLHLDLGFWPTDL